MRADICEPDDAFTVRRFREVLATLGAEKLDEAWAADVDLVTVSIRGRVLSIFRDAWSLDIEGPDDLVAEIVRRMKG